MENKDNLQDIFSKNRAEEIGYDVWKHFVIPPFYNKLDFITARKPRVVIGGRGCGKTMLLRYLSHQSMFSKERIVIPDDAIKHIGLYWRIDTQFCNAMVKRDISDDIWYSAFNHFAALILGMETLNSLQSIATSSFPSIDESQINNIDFAKIRAFDSSLPNTLSNLRDKLEEYLWEFESWVNDVRKKEQPYLLPGKDFILAIIKIIQKNIPILSESIFYVYFDEYENLTEYQKKIINTWLKHSEYPLIFNLAMKRNAFDVRETTGTEAISDISDYRKHDLEAYILEENFPIFAAEILFLQLSFIDFQHIPINIENLRDPNALPIRKSKEYSQNVLNAIKKIFPDVSFEILAQQVFEDTALASKLKEKIMKSLDFRMSNLKADDFLKKQVPEASIIIPALLNRKRYTPQEVSQELNKLLKNKENRFTGKTNWIHNNFVACLLQLYAPYSRACPFFAGFQTFCKLARGNIRYLLELCHKSLYISIDDNGNLELPVTTTKQAEAARHASTAFLGEIKSFGKHGNQLHTFILRLGFLFNLAHQRPSQSESEQSHFSIRSGNQNLAEDDVQFLNETVKWSVLFEYEDTKKKDKTLPLSNEYILNPIYSPYFHISYRKKRKLELSTNNLICLIKGTLDEYRKFMKYYSRRWSIGTDEFAPSLFTVIEENFQNEN